MALFWLLCAARVLGGIAWGETFGAEATMAAMGVIGLPWLVLPGRRRRKRSARGR